MDLSAGAWAAFGVFVTVGVAMVAGVWRLGVQISEWRHQDSQRVARLAHLWARWLDDAEDRDVGQNREIADVKNRLWEIESHMGVRSTPPNGGGPFVSARRHRLDAIQTFPEVQDIPEDDYEDI